MTARSSVGDGRKVYCRTCTFMLAEPAADLYAACQRTPPPIPAWVGRVYTWDGRGYVRFKTYVERMNER